jgi:hypothetical protein
MRLLASLLLFLSLASAEEGASEMKGSTMMIHAVSKIDADTLVALVRGTPEGETPRPRARGVPGAKIKDPVFVDSTDGMDKWHITPFFYAAFNNKADVLPTLRGLGADVNWRDHQGFTAVHAAAFKGAAEALSVLLKFPEVNLSAAEADGLTPLLRACSGKKEEHVAAVRTILMSGRVAPDERDPQGRTCAQILDASAGGVQSNRANAAGMRTVLADATARYNMARAAAEAAASRGIEADI